MGGEIWLQSEERKGTEISFELPTALGNKSSQPRPPAIREDSLRWSIPERRDVKEQTKQNSRIQKLALFHENAQTRNLLLEIFPTIGITVVDHKPDPMEIDDVDHDAVFLDMDFFEQIPALCIKLLGADKHPCIVLYSDKDRGQFFKAVSEADNVILVRRPLAIHRLGRCLGEPWRYMGGYPGGESGPSPPKPNVIENVSFTTERQELAAKIASSSRIRFETTISPITEPKVPITHPKKVLMVEDNAVNGKMGLKLLSIAGYTGELAEDGVVALRMITKPGAQYDVVLMDCHVHLQLCFP